MKNGASTALARQEKLSDLIKRRTEIRHALVASEKPLQEKLKDIHPSYLKSARNLAHYIALRHRDIRPRESDASPEGEDCEIIDPVEAGCRRGRA